MSDTREGQDLVKPKLDIFGAAEGQELDLLGTDTADQQRIHGSGNATAPAVVTGSILIAVRDPVAAGTIREAAKADGISLLELGSAKEVFAAVDAFQPPVVILEYESCGADCIEQYVEGVGRGPAGASLLIVADQEDKLPRSEVRTISSLIRPFSSAYARTCIRASMLRRALRWQRVLATQDESSVSPLFMLSGSLILLPKAVSTRSRILLLPALAFRWRSLASSTGSGSGSNQATASAQKRHRARLHFALMLSLHGPC